MLRKAVVISAALGLAFATAWVGASSSGAEEMTHCSFQHEPTLNPGLSYKPSSGTFDDPGGGTADCHGMVNGHTPTGPGTYVDSGHYGTKDPDTCQGGGEAEGDPQIVIPTDAGPQTITDHIKITYGKPSTHGGLVHADFEGAHSSGTIELTPLKGDCILSPVSKVRGVGEMMLK